ncbi:MAG: 4-(cytidine 5'-diphospho)-2-C-methyl-D-erythritol kinase [Gammaproteobacteria bacterium]|nr:4-(cytidine 5'-diphospho)-2-C-methyl-D-erythritol kinase [Gammaproteobacteria bacterium]
MTEGPLTGDFPWPAPAKLNLFLHILGRRADGYHDLQSVFQMLDYGDDLYFEPRDDGAVRRVGGPAGIPQDEDLVVRAARALQAATGCRQGCDIRVHKRIPLGGGLGGGSSDAATTLVALNLIWRTGRTTDQLAALGLTLGADVPVFVRGTAAWAEGVGERLRPVEVAEPWFLVVTPRLAIGTREIFNAPELPRDSAPIGWRDFLQGRHRNDCEATVCARYPEVRRALDWLGRFAPSRMSGTGASVFAAFAERTQATAVRDQVPTEWNAFIARGCNRSPLYLAAETWAKP